MRVPEYENTVTRLGILLALAAGVNAGLMGVLATLFLGLGVPGYVGSAIVAVCASISLIIGVFDK